MEHQSWLPLYDCCILKWLLLVFLLWEVWMPCTDASHLGIPLLDRGEFSFSYLEEFWKGEIRCLVWMFSVLLLFLWFFYWLVSFLWPRMIGYIRHLSLFGYPEWFLGRFSFSLRDNFSPSALIVLSRATIFLLCLESEKFLPWRGFLLIIGQILCFPSFLLLGRVTCLGETVILDVSNLYWLTSDRESAVKLLPPVFLFQFPSWWSLGSVVLSCRS